MNNIQNRIKEVKKTKEVLNTIISEKSHVLIIHYSCESFYDIKDGKTPRITSIAVRFLNSGQTKSFSIHKVAELNSIQNSEIDANYDKLEREMLVDFYLFLKKHETFMWIHWNMRNINYGFEAINHRASVLGLTPENLDDNKKIDLAILLKSRYGNSYADHPRLQYILDKNNITPKNLLEGNTEAIAFDNKEFVKLHQSTLSKVDALDILFNLTCNDKLKTKSKFFEIYEISPQGIFELVKDNWLLSVIFFVIASLIGIGIGKLLE